VGGLTRLLSKPPYLFVKRVPQKIGPTPKRVKGKYPHGSWKIN